MKLFILACLIVVALAADHGHHGHHHDSGHHGHPHPEGHTGCNQDASKCDGCGTGLVGHCVNDVCHCKNGPIVRQAAHLTCTSHSDCSSMHCGHVHGAGHNHGGYCTPNHHCSCHRSSSCQSATDCIGYCVGAHANGTSTCHQIHGHGHCTHCH